MFFQNQNINLNVRFFIITDSFKNLKLVGQERDCGLIAIWTALVQDKQVTHVGLFHEIHPSVQVVTFFLHF